MKNVYFTVGPTQTFAGLDKCVRDALRNGVGSISHRGRTFEEIFAHTTGSLKQLLNVPKDFHVFFLGSATEAMERIIESCVKRDSFHFVNGAFSKRFYITAKELKKNAMKSEIREGKGFELADAGVPAEAEVVCLTHNETSTGVALDMGQVYGLKKRNPGKLFALDMVSSAPYVAVDYRYIDCAFFSVQKGFGLPAGLGVLIVSDKCLQKSIKLQAKGLNIGSYHSFPSLAKSEAKYNTPETPNVLWIYLLGQVADSYIKKGMQNIRKETDEKAELIYDFFGNRRGYSPFVKNPDWRSKTTIVIETLQGSSRVIRKLAKGGYIVAPGYGEFADKHIRIGNFPMHKLADVKKMLKILE